MFISVFLVRVLALFVIVVFIRESNCLAQERRGPRDFVSAAPAELFYTEDEMSEAEKLALVKHDFRKVNEANSTTWGVLEERENRLVLQYCPGSQVVVHVYRNVQDPSSGVVAVSSVRAS